MPTSDFVLQCGPESVQLWSDFRLPFEPKGQMRQARDDLRQALRQLVAQGDQIIDATDTSLDSGLCDVENVLFYNVGAAAFVNSARTGLRFSRVRCEPPPCSAGRRFAHLCEYRLIGLPGAPNTTPDVSFRFSLPLGGRGITSPHEAWWEATTASGTSSGTIGGRFGMRVVIESTKPLGNLASLQKPLLDGIISALHTDPAPDAEAVRRLAGRTGRSADEIFRRLQNPAHAVLGPRHVLHPYRDFVKWNPADELCESCTLFRRDSSSECCCVEIWSDPGR